MFTKSSLNYINKQLNYYIFNRIAQLIIIIIIIGILIYYSCINENFKVSKTIHLDTFYFKTDEQKKNGLMNIKKPLGNKGALFIYSAPQKICLWMKNTFIPLDTIILNKDFNIIEFLPNLKPQNLITKCSKNKNGYYFIEVDAGYINKNKLNIGDKIICNEIPLNLDKQIKI